MIPSYVAVFSGPGLYFGLTIVAFWLLPPFLHAQDYFRDITQEDVRALMPVFIDPSLDEALTVPFLGEPIIAEERGSRAGRPPALLKEEAGDDGVSRDTTGIL